MLPDELQHQELVKIGVEQGPRNRVQFPVVIVRTTSEVHDHSQISSPSRLTKSNRDAQQLGALSGRVRKSPRRFALQFTVNAASYGRLAGKVRIHR
jgi:hypothetical protein